MKEKNNRILLVADLSPKEVIPVIQESIGICRFEFTLEALVRAEAVPFIRRILPAIHLTELESMSCDYEPEGICAVLAAVTQDLTARLALGLQDKKSAEIILQSLWLGIPVFIDFSMSRILKGKPCANKQLEHLYEKYRADVKKLGVNEILPGEYLITIREELSAENSVGISEPETISIRPAEKKIITYRDIMKTVDAKMEFKVPQDAIITAYARDMAKKQGIALREEGGQRCWK